MAEIDLENPGSLVATARNARSYTFYLVRRRPEYRPETFERDPVQVPEADLLFASGPLPEKDGAAEASLAGSEAAIDRKCDADETEALAVVVAEPVDSGGPRKAVVEPHVIRKRAAAFDRACLDGARWR